jgi:hypothetical protein
MYTARNIYSKKDIYFLCKLESNLSVSEANTYIASLLTALDKINKKYFLASYSELQRLLTKEKM